MEPIRYINPSFDSALVSEVFNLERLRYMRLGGTTPPWLFYDLREIMHILESVASARIEGNNTTVVGAAVDSLEQDKAPKNEDVLELRNIRSAIGFIENYMEASDSIVDPGFIRELHKTLVNGLKRDGSKTPGKWRVGEVKIEGSAHMPPNHIEVPALIQELCDFINADASSKEDIIKIAIAHHRFTAIHPFDNGNGRTARLMTYAMLAKLGFINKAKRAFLNPSAVFCMDRQKYYRMLATADKGTDQGLEEWSLYVATGIAAEMDRVNRLLDKSYAVKNIIDPALRNALDSKFISNEEYQILKIAMDKDIIQVQDIKHIFGTTPSDAVQASRVIANMKEKKLLMTLPGYQKKYVMRFSNNYLLRDVLSSMDKNGLLVVKNEADND